MNTDWSTAEDHLHDIKKAIDMTEKMSSRNHVNMGFYKSVYNDLRKRFDNGERTDKFFQEIMEFEV